jgi:hypothetical protein
MNERIDQLMVKAGAYFGVEGVVYDTFDPKKFAELIVKECVINVKDWEKDSRNHISYMLERHFGVEE